MPQLPVLRFRPLICAVAVLFVSACTDSPAPGDEIDDASGHEALVAELLGEVALLEEKLLGLADVVPGSAYDWHPADGVRSVAEVLMHVTTLNVAFPLFAGHEAPPSTGLTLESLSSAAPAYESSLESKSDIQPALTASFAHLRAAIAATAPGEFSAPVVVFGETQSQRSFWVGHVGHLHEHLGQLIAYARMNGIAPPWS